MSLSVMIMVNIELVREYFDKTSVYLQSKSAVNVLKYY